MHRIRDKMLVNPNAHTASTGPLPEYPELKRNLNEWCEGMLMEGIGFKTDNILYQALILQHKLKNGMGVFKSAAQNLTR
jgi:hypothetical protein